MSMWRGRLIWVGFTCLVCSGLFSSAQAESTAQNSIQSQPQAQTPAPTTPPNQPTQGSDGAYTIRSTVPLVILDVVVTDAKGKPVRDLTRSDFHVQESEAPQQILDFEEAGSQVQSTNLNIDSTADLDRVAPKAPVQIIVLDEFNTRFEDMAFARYSLKKFLERQPARMTTPTMLLSVDLSQFKVLHDYTLDREAILKALDKHFVGYPWRLKSEWVPERYAAAFSTLRRVAQATTGHPGHKNMIWVGRGFPPYNFSNAPVDQEQRINNAMQNCVNVLRDARITLYTIDPAGVIFDPQKYGSAAAFNDPMGGNFQFDALARATGGTGLHRRNDVDAEIGTAIQDGTNFYTLTYRPTNSSRDPRQFRKIKITVDRPGTSVLTRQGYYLQYGPGKVDPNKPSRQLVADLLAADTTTMAYDGVPISVEPPADGTDVFQVHLDGKGLIWANATADLPRHVDFILMASTFDKKGIELKREARNFSIKATGDVPDTGRLIRDVDLKYHFDLDARAVRARFTVRLSASGRIGAVDTPLKAAAKP